MLDVVVLMHVHGARDATKCDRVGIVGGWLCDRIYHIFLALQRTIEKNEEKLRFKSTFTR